MSLPKKRTLRNTFRNLQIGACWTGGLVGGQLASWATRDPSSVQHVAYTALYYADKVRLKKQLENGPQ